MKKTQRLLLGLFLMTFSISTVSMAQNVKGSNFVNAGIGIGTFGFSGTGGLPVTLSFEHGFTDKISAGACLAMVHTTYATDWKYSYYLFGVKGSYHFNEELKITNPKVDVYGGASIFYRGYRVKYTGPDNQKETASAGGMAIAIHAGARYFSP